MLTVSANIGGVVAEIGSIYIGESKLTLTTDYTVDEDEITIKKETLVNLDEGNHIIVIETDVNTLTVKLEVIDTEEE